MVRNSYLFLILLLFGCSDSPPAPSPCLLLKETFSSTSLSYERTFTYQDGRLATMTYNSTVPSGPASTTSFTYGTNGLVDSAVTVWSGSLYPIIAIYSYNTSGRLSRVATNIGDTTDFDYNTSGQITRKFVDQFMNDYTREYSYPNTTTTNYTQSVLITSGGLKITETYSYDDHSNPLFRSPAWTDDYFADTENNITKIENDYSGGPIEYTYTYDAKGLPVSRTKVGTSDTWAYTLSCP